MPQVRDLEQQLIQSTQPNVTSEEEELLGAGELQRNRRQDRNLSHIRTIEKEKREAFEVCVTHYTIILHTINQEG